MIALVLLILTIWFGYKSLINKSSYYQLLTVFVDAAWIIYSFYMHSHWYAIFWVIIIALDTKTYEKYKALEQNNEQEED